MSVSDSLSFTLRAFEKKDSQQCCDIINEGIRTMDGLNEAARNFIYAKNQPEILFQELNSFYTIVAEEDEKLLGLGALAGTEIKRVYALPDARGRSVGSSIMKALETEAIKRSLPLVEVDASPASVGFYEKCGFNVIKPGSARHGDAEFHFIIMTKHLRTTA